MRIQSILKPSFRVFKNESLFSQSLAGIFNGLRIYLHLHIGRCTGLITLIILEHILPFLRIAVILLERYTLFFCIFVIGVQNDFFFRFLSHNCAGLVDRMGGILGKCLILMPHRDWAMLIIFHAVGLGIKYSVHKSRSTLFFSDSIGHSLSLYRMMRIVHFLFRFGFGLEWIIFTLVLGSWFRVHCVINSDIFHRTLVRQTDLVCFLIFYANWLYRYITS